MQEIIDPITLEVIYHRLASIADEMEIALLKSSFSPIVKEGRDCSTAIFNARGETVAQATAIPTHLGTLMASVPQILKVFPTSEIQEGDIFIANDPYSGGTHLPDITMVTPVKYQDEVVALAVSMVHHQDIGAMTPGVPTSATSIYQEGLNIPPVKFYDAGEPVKSIHNIIRKNVRIPDMIIGDLRAQVAAGNVGKLRLVELFEEYGKDTILAAMTQLMDYAENMTREELRKIPSGSYSFVDYMDNDGVDLNQRIKFQVKVTVQGSELNIDFSGTSPQVRGPFNLPPSGALAASAFVLRAITGASIPNNAGCFRPMSLHLPEGSIVNPRPPAAVGARASTIARVSDLLMGAMVKAVPERLPAGSGSVLTILYFGGTDPLTGQDYVTVDPGVGGQGARPTKDGVDTIQLDTVLGLNNPVEAIELQVPVRIVKWDLRMDSAGAGKYRGGLGLEKVWKVLHGPVSVTFRGERHYTRPWGLFGGLPGARQEAFIIRTTGEIEEIPSKVDVILNDGDELRLLTPGGAGYGDPLNREPEFVLDDVLNSKVSLEAAANDYGVIIDKESMTVNYEKTDKVRKERRRIRGPITWTYDRGPELGRE